MKQEPRYKLFRINPDLVVDMLNWNQYKQITLPIVKGIPPDAVVEDIHHDYSRRCFVARVYHESFDEVKKGMVIPMDSDWLEVERRSIDVEAYQDACNQKDFRKAWNKAKDETIKSFEIQPGKYRSDKPATILPDDIGYKGLPSLVQEREKRFDSIHLGFKPLKD